MTYWLQHFTDNPIGAFVDLVLLAMLAVLLLYGFLIVRARFKKLLEQASFMVPHHVGISAASRSASPSVYVIELGCSLVVGYSATDVQDAERVCKRRWLRRGLRAWSLKMFRLGTEKPNLLRGRQMQARAFGS